MAQKVGGKRKQQPGKGGFGGSKAGRSSNKQPRLDSKAPGHGGRQHRDGAGVLEAKGKGTQAKRVNLADIYEAEDSDPDEVKNSKRYDVSGILVCCA